MSTRKLNKKNHRLFSKRITPKLPTKKMRAQPVGLQLESLEQRLMLDAEISVLALGGGDLNIAGNTNVSSGASQFDYVDATYGDSPLTASFQIKNDDPINVLWINGGVSVSDGFSILSSNQPATFLPPGATSTLTVQMDTQTPGAHVGTVNFKTNDNTGGENPFTFTLTGFVNALPTAIAGGDLTVTEGEVVTFRGDYDDANTRADDPITFNWDFGGGNTATTQDATFIFDDDANYASPYTVTFTVTDSHGGTHSDTLDVTVVNAVPVVDLGEDQGGTEGVPVNFTGSFTDAGSSDTHTYSWDFGDGSPAVTTLNATHTYADNGIYTARLTVTDDDSGVGFDEQLVIVNNDNPLVNAGADQAVAEGDSVSFTGGITDLGVPTDTLEFNWDFGDGSTSGAQNPTHTYTDNGVYTAIFTVVDDDGGVDFDSMTVTVANVAPVTNVGADQAVDEGDLVSFTGSFTDPGAGDTHTYVWDFGDGSPALATFSLNANHTYADNGTYTVSLTVTDDDGGSHADTLDVVVANVAPTTDAGADQAITEGDVVSFNGSFTDPGTDDTHIYTWDFGDGSPVVGTLNATHVYADNGNYTATLIVVDDDGGFQTNTLAVNVANADPMVNIGEDMGGTEGVPVNFTGSFTDAGSGDTHTYLWDFGDGSPAVTTLNATHTYADNGIYTARLTVTDDDGGVGYDEQLVIVNNDNPLVNAGADQAVDEGTSVSFTGGITDLGVPTDTLEFNWDFGDGGTSDAQNPTHTYTDNGVYTAIFTVVDDDGGIDFDSMTVTVANVAPVTNVGADQAVDEGDLVSFTGSFTDPGAGDTHTYVWDFGDGSATLATPTLDATHAFANEGVYTVQLTVTDDDGGSHADTLSVTVANVAPIADAGGIAGVYTINEGDGVLLDGTGTTDPGINDGLVYSWSINGAALPFTDSMGFVNWSYLEGVLNLSGDGIAVPVSLIVNDGTDNSVVNTVNLVINNVAPTADAGGSYTINEGEILGLDGSGSNDPNANDTLTYVWDLDGDGFDDGNGVNETVSWSTIESLASDGQPIQIRMRVTDSEGASSIDTAWISINNLPAAVETTGPYTFVEGDSGTITLSGKAIDLDNNDVFSYAWDLDNDGIYGETHEPSGNGPIANGAVFTDSLNWASLVALGLPSDGTEIAISLRVDDGDGGPQGQGSYAYAWTTLTIDNVAPTADAGGAYVITEGEDLDLLNILDASGSTDPDARDVLIYSWDLDGDDDYELTAGANAMHSVPWETLQAFGLPSDGSTWDIHLRVDDGQGGVSVDTTTLTINNAAPVADPDGPYDILEGEDLLLDGSHSSDPGDDPLTYSWTLNGTPIDVSGYGEFLYVPWSWIEAQGVDGDGSELTIGLQVDDGIVNSGPEATTTLTIFNVAPTADADGTYVINEGSSITLNAFNSTDPNANDELTYAWDLDGDGIYGEVADGEPTGISPTISWATLESLGFPSNSSPLAIGLEVTDDDGGVDTDMTVLVINNVPPTVDAGDDLLGLMESEIFFDGTFSDPAGTLDSHEILWDFGDGNTADTIDAVHTYTQSGYYTVSLTVTDQDLGQITDTMQMIVEQSIEVNDANKAVLYTNHGVVVVTLTGPGTMQLYHIDGLLTDFNRIVLDDTTEDSSLLFKTVGPHSDADTIDSRYSYVTLGDITINGSLNKITGTTAKLYGDITVGAGSLGSLVLDDMMEDSSVQTAMPSLKGFKLKAADIGQSVTFDLADDVKTFRADQYLGGSLTSNSINNFVIRKGDLGADVTTQMNGEINLMRVQGDIQGDILSAASIGRVVSNTGGLTPEASITANGGDIKSVTTKGDIQGDVLSSMSIGKVISRTGALTAEASVIANGGDITRASFKTDVDGMLLASESIGNVTGRQGTLRGTLRAGMEISRVKFNDIDSATVSAGGDIGSVLSSNSIVDSALLAGYDIGADGLPGTLDEVFNDSGASIGKIRLNLRTGNFDGTSAAAGVKPFDYDVNTETWTMLAPAGEVQGLASYGKIGPSTVGQVFLNGNPNSGVYGLFAATEAIDRVRFIEVAASGAPDFEIISTW